MVVGGNPLPVYPLPGPLADRAEGAPKICDKAIGLVHGSMPVKNMGGPIPSMQGLHTRSCASVRRARRAAVFGRPCGAPCGAPCGLDSMESMPVNNKSGPIPLMHGV